jgi:cholesterol oxidase
LVSPSSSPFPSRGGNERAPPRGSTPNTRHQAVLLAMGRDDVPARLALDDQQQLVARFPHGGFPTLAEEERVMRAIADQLGGTLHSNPLWALARQPVTAHSHGGCALGRVTDEWGEVKNYPGLFINDGSLLPTPVEVNPASTIAALAERNIRHFAQKLGNGTLPASWQADIDGASRWAKLQRKGGVDLEPPRPKPILLHHARVGLAFAENMSGHMLPFTSPEPLELSTSQASRIPLARFLSAEGKARDRKIEVAFQLTATVPDIGTFLNDPSHSIDLSGSLCFGPGIIGVGPVSLAKVEGTLSLLVDVAPGRQLMIYNLPFTHDGEPWTLLGEKEIQKNAGFDAWLDASTLYVELIRGRLQPRKHARRLLSGRKAIQRSTHNAHARGVLRLGLHDFVTNQLRSLRPIGTDDPQRVIWTLGTFGVFFFGRLQGIYAPEIDRFLALFGRSAWRSTQEVRQQGDDSDIFRVFQGP